MKKHQLRVTFFKYIFFNILSTLGVSVYILIDTFFIAKGMGTDGLTALNLCLPVFNFINGFGLMLGMGGGSRYSMLFGRTERTETDNIFTNAFWAALAVSACFVLTGVFFSRQVTSLLGADSSIFDFTHSYLRTVLLSTPAFILNNLLVCFLRNDGAPRLAMAGVLGGSFANVVLDYVFIFVLHGSMKGAALATCISPLISMAIMSIHFFSGWNAFRLRLTRPSLKILYKIVSLGLHTFFTECSGGLVIIVFNFIIYRLAGNTGIAAYGVIANLAIVFTAIFSGLSSGVQPLLCKAHGNLDKDAKKYLLWLSIITTMFLALLAYGGIYMNDARLVAIFNSSANEQLAAIAENGLRLYFLFMPSMGVNLVFSVYFTSCDQPRLSQLISLLRGTVFVLPLAFLFYSMRTLDGIWLTIPSTELLTACGAFLTYYVITPYEVYVYHYVPKQNTRNVQQ